MDRYKIALGKSKRSVVQKFRPSNSVTRVYEYMKKCILARKDYDTDGIASSIVDSALVRLSKEYNAPIVTMWEKEARVITLGHGFPFAYSLANLPEHVEKVICYWDIGAGYLTKAGRSDVIILLRLHRSERATNGQ